MNTTVTEVNDLRVGDAILVGGRRATITEITTPSVNLVQVIRAFLAIEDGTVTSRTWGSGRTRVHKFLD